MIKTISSAELRAYLAKIANPERSSSEFRDYHFNCFVDSWYGLKGIYSI